MTMKIQAPILAHITNALLYYVPICMYACAFTCARADTCAREQKNIPSAFIVGGRVCIREKERERERERERENK